MPVFQPRNRIQILREMVARVVSRSKLAGLVRNSVVFHVLAAAANEDAEQYVQIARLKKLFSIDRATGSDLDERAKDIVPATIFRRGALHASGDVVFSRPGTTGTINIAVGSQVAASDAEGPVRFRTLAAATILAGNTTSGSVPVIATEAGIRGNVAANQIVRLLTRPPGVTAVTNPAAFENGSDRESDASFRARLKNWVQAISRGTPNALESFARNVILPDGRRVLFASVVEPIVPDGTVVLYIDDGTGSAETFDSAFIGSPDVFVSAIADGGEFDFFTTERPIRDDGSFQLEADTGSGYAAQVRGTDYDLNPATGQVTLRSASFPAGLPVGSSLRAEYRYYTGLIAETQRIIEGDPDDLRVPGVRAAGIQVAVRTPLVVFQSLVGSLSVREGFDSTVVLNNVQAAIQDYINNLDIGADIIVAEIIERAMAVDGMFNFRISDLTGSSPAADQVVLSNQVARITSSNITLT